MRATIGIGHEVSGIRAQIVAYLEAITLERVYER